LNISTASVSFMEGLLKLSEGNIIHKTYVIKIIIIRLASTIMLTYRP
jgi:hypothetical protein